MTAIQPNNFGDILDICERRGRIVGTVKVVDRDLMKGFINEYYTLITTERNWKWRSFERAWSFKRSIATGTVSVTNGQRTATFTGLTISNQHLGRTLKITGDSELYRIIGINTVTNSVYLESEYIGTTNLLATYKLYQYEFALPPDCDTINDFFIIYESSFRNEKGSIIEVSLPEYNRLLSSNVSLVDIPCFYCRDGQNFVKSNIPPLDRMILDYDFLGGDDKDKTEQVKVFPIEPDIDRVMHLNYGLMVKPLISLTQKPLIPLDNRWVLVHFALYEWFKNNGQNITADKELRDAKIILREMRNEHRRGQTPPKFIVDATRFRRFHYYRSNKDDIFRISDALET